MRIQGLGAATAAALMAACSADSAGHTPHQSVWVPRPISDFITNVATEAGDAGVLESSDAPAPSGGPEATVTGMSTVLPGGSTFVDVSAGAAFDGIYVSVLGATGHYRVPVTSGTSQTLVITVAQDAPLAFGLRIATASGTQVGTASVGPFATLAIHLRRVGTGPIQVSVVWDTRTDVDLHLVEPGGEEIYYGHTTSAAGGTLDLDSNPACRIDNFDNENITYQDAVPPSGTYTVRVDYYDECSQAQTRYVVTVNVNGAVQTYHGSFTGPGDTGGAGSGVTIATFAF